MLTQAELRQHLNYAPDTGVFLWLRGKNKGKRAGRMNSKGRRQITLCRKLYTASHLAQLYMTGRWTERQMDHRNLDRQDDAWGNFRPATNQQNCYNRKQRGDSTLPWKGVRRAPSGRYGARITADTKDVWLGTYDCPAAAHLAYVVAVARLHGEFAYGGRSA